LNSSPWSFSVRAGTAERGNGGELLEVAKWNETENEKMKKWNSVLQVSNIWAHPYYDPESKDFDFAIIQLKSPIHLDGVTKAAIDLPADNEPTPYGVKATVTGWGRTENSHSSRYLLSASLSTISPRDCYNLWKGGLSTTDRMLCAWDQNKIQGGCFVS
jgi:hypothetical protein